MVGGKKEEEKNGKLGKPGPRLEFW
jgi:hypothetical protein